MPRPYFGTILTGKILKNRTDFAIVDITVAEELGLWKYVLHSNIISRKRSPAGREVWIACMLPILHLTKCAVTQALSGDAKSVELGLRLNSCLFSTEYHTRTSENLQI